MSTTYSVIAGDSFSTIARKKYGSEVDATRIAQANPGAVEPLTVGTVLNIPLQPEDPKDKAAQEPAANADEVNITIAGDTFRFWTGVRIEKKADSLTVISFTAPFEHTAEGFRDAFRPFAFTPVTASIGGVLYFTGTMISVEPVVSDDSKALSINCYSLPGVLNDCNPPPASYPVEYKNQRLEDIAKSIVKPFGVGIVFDAEQGSKFQKVANGNGRRGSGMKILPFLSELSAQRDLVLTDDERGRLVFKKSVDAGNPVAILKQGEQPLISVTPTFSPQNYYSHITGIVPPKEGSGGAKYTWKNPHLTGTLRSYVFTISDTNGSDIKSVVESKAARMFANMVSYQVLVPSWRDPQGDLWSPDTTIKLTAPDAMIYNEYEFLIRNVVLNKQPDSKTATLNVIIPGGFSGQIPEALPWD